MSSLTQAEAHPLPATRPDRVDIASRDASIVLGLTLPTDTVLYLLLPLHAADFGVSLAEAGLLLAANRLVRILGYGFVARSYERQGPRVACTVAVLGSAASSLGRWRSAGMTILLEWLRGTVPRDNSPQTRTASRLRTDECPTPSCAAGAH